MPRKYLIIVVAFAALCAAVLLSPGTAAAGDVQLKFCTAAPDRNASVFALPKDRGMLARADCAATGGSREGVMTRTAQTGKSIRVKYQDYAAAVWQAPPGTVIVEIQWGGYWRRQNCDWLAQLRLLDGHDPAANNKLLRGSKSGSVCNTPNSRGARVRRARTLKIASDPRYQMPNPTTLVQRVICQRRVGCPIGRDTKAFMVTEYLTVKVSDTAPPETLVMHDSPLFNGWVNGTRDLLFTAADRGSGVQSVRALGEPGASGVQTQLAGFPRSCSFSRQIACDNGDGAMAISASAMPRQGTQNVWIEAADAAGNRVTAGPRQVHVDTLAPGPSPVTVAPEAGDPVGTGEEWRNTPTFTLGWTNADQVGDVAPITAFRYSLCPHASPPKACTNVRDSGLGAPLDQLMLSEVPAGESNIQVWRTDAAGNTNQTNSSEPVTVRYDPVPPTGTFDAVSTADPTLLAGSVADQYSGVTSAQVEISQRGSNSWEGVDTQLSADGRIGARVSDVGRAPGAWVARVTVRDRAGNVYVSPDDKQLQFTVPLRTVTRLSAGVFEERTVKTHVRRHGKRRTVRKTVTSLQAQGHAGFGEQVRVAGALTDSTGRGIGGATIAMTTTSQIGLQRSLGTTVTDAQGIYTYDVPADSTQTVQAHYAGTPLILPAEAQTQLTVSAATTFKVSRKKVPNGRAVVFSGRVLSGPLGPQGKNVDLQVKIAPGEPWDNFGQDPHADASGRWQKRYKFSRIARTVTLRFRAVIPSEIGYPYTEGRSRTIAVKVIGAAG